MRLGHGDLHIGHGRRAARVEGEQRVLTQADGLGHLAQLVVADERRSGALADLVAVADVVGVAVGGQHEVGGIDLVAAQRGGRVVVQPRVEVADRAAVRLEAKRRVADVRDRDPCHVVLLYAGNARRIITP